MIVGRARTPATAPYRVVSPIQHDGVPYPIGSEIDLLPDDAEPLVSAGAAVPLIPRKQRTIPESELETLTLAVRSLQGYLAVARLDPRIEASPIVEALARDLEHSLHDPLAFVDGDAVALGLTRIARQIQNTAARRSTKAARSTRELAAEERRADVLRRCDEARKGNRHLSSDKSVAEAVSREIGIPANTIRRWLGDRKKLAHAVRVSSA